MSGTANGFALDGNANGLAGHDYVSQRDTLNGPGPRLYRIFGDVTGDGSTNSSDVPVESAAYGTASGDPGYRAYLDANNDGFISGFDFNLFSDRLNANVVTIAPPPTFYVNPATGNDANDGRSPSTAWATWARLVTAVQNGTIFSGEWEAADGSLADINTIPSIAAKDAWYAAYNAGQRHVTGPSMSSIRPPRRSR